MTMDDTRHRSQRGYSLLETLVTVSIFLLVLFAVYTVLESSRVIYAKGEGKVDVQQGARAVMDQIATPLRNAGYFPENFTTPPPGILLANPIQVAADNALAIYGDADGSGASNVFFFCQNGSLVRWVRSVVGVPGAYTCDQGMVLARNVTSLTFTYFDANNNSIPNPPTPPYQLDGQGTGAVPSFLDTTQRGAVRRVVVTLTATEDIPGQQPQTYTLTSNVRLRNLK
jgi:prepilin-type N-terminal cleavage/methylation domain-containing protein